MSEFGDFSQSLIFRRGEVAFIIGYVSYRHRPLMVRVNACKMIIDALSTMAGVNAPLHWLNGDIHIFSNDSCSETAANCPITAIGLFEE